MAGQNDRYQHRHFSVIRAIFIVIIEILFKYILNWYLPLLVLPGLTGATIIAISDLSPIQFDMGYGDMGICL